MKTKGTHAEANQVLDDMHSKAGQALDTTDAKAVEGNEVLKDIDSK